MKNIAVVLILFLLLSLTACNDELENKADTNANAKVQTKKQIGNTGDDSDDLAEIIKLSFIPEDVVWQQYEVNGGKQIIAVIRFTPADTATILAQSQTGEKVELAAERWYPQELIAQSDTAGDQVLHGTTFVTNIFYKDSFDKGKVIKLDGSDYFVLEISTF